MRSAARDLGKTTEAARWSNTIKINDHAPPMDHNGDGALSAYSGFFSFSFFFLMLAAATCTGCEQRRPRIVLAG